MFTWICKRDRPGRLLRPGFFLGAVCALSGCLGDGTGGGFSFAPRDEAEAAAAEPLRRVELVRGNVVVEGPRGYCIDPDSVSRQQGGFALLASCESLSGARGVPVEPAVMTVSVLPRLIDADQPRADDLVASLAPAEAHMTRDGDGVAIAHLNAGGDTVLPEGDPAHWRAAMVINGHLVGLAVYGRKGSPLAGTAGEELIRALSESLRAASPETDYSPDGDAASVSTEPKQGTGLKSVLGGLFPKRS